MSQSSPAAPHDFSNAPRRQRSGGFRAQLRVIGALFMRELLTRFGRSRIGYVWLVLEPLSLAIMISTLHWVSGHALPNDLPIFLFYALGYMPFMLFRSVMAQTARGIRMNVSMLYHRDIKLFDVIFARTLMESAVCTAGIALIMIVAAVFFGYLPHEPGLFVVGLVLAALLANGLGMVFATLIELFEPFEHVVHPFTYIMMPLSAAFFMLDTMPYGTQQALLWNPVVHINEMNRWAYWGDQIVAHFDITYPILWAMGLNLVGLAGLRIARSRIALMD